MEFTSKKLKHAFFIPSSADDFQDVKSRIITTLRKGSRTLWWIYIFKWFHV